uniref:eRF1 domain-containing protein n=1 Tax=Ignisphaera aggregans TaxID=334771 RepID=A0A7J3MY48_9CREN
MLKFLKPMNLLLVSVDFDEYSIALLQMQGLRIVDEKNVSLPVSDEGFEEAVEDLVDELARRIVETARRYRVEAVVIGSPGDLKNRIKKVIESLDRELRIYTDSVANGGYAGLQELLHRDIVRSVIKDTAIAKASEILEYFDMLIVKDIGRVAYGIDHVEIAAEVGAVEKLLIIDELLSGFSEIREKIDKILRNVVEKNGNIVIVPSKSPPGERVKMLGGVMAILRYALDTEWLKNSKDYN